MDDGRITPTLANKLRGRTTTSQPQGINAAGISLAVIFTAIFVVITVVIIVCIIKRRNTREEPEEKTAPDEKEQKDIEYKKRHAALNPNYEIKLSAPVDDDDSSLSDLDPIDADIYDNGARNYYESRERYGLPYEGDNRVVVGRSRSTIGVVANKKFGHKRGKPDSSLDDAEESFYEKEWIPKQPIRSESTHSQKGILKNKEVQRQRSVKRVHIVDGDEIDIHHNGETIVESLHRDTVWDDGKKTRENNVAPKSSGKINECNVTNVANMNVDENHSIKSFVVKNKLKKISDNNINTENKTAKNDKTIVHNGVGTIGDSQNGHGHTKVVYNLNKNSKNKILVNSATKNNKSSNKPIMKRYNSEPINLHSVFDDNCKEQNSDVEASPQIPNGNYHTIRDTANKLALKIQQNNDLSGSSKIADKCSIIYMNEFVDNDGVVNEAFDAKVAIVTTAC